MDLLVLYCLPPLRGVSLCAGSSSERAKPPEKALRPPKQKQPTAPRRLQRTRTKRAEQRAKVTCEVFENRRL